MFSRIILRNSFKVLRNSISKQILRDQKKYLKISSFICRENKGFHNIYVHDEEESVNTKQSTNKFTYRTYNCGELTSNNIGETVTLCGWLEYQRMNKFVVLRDAYGQTQLLMSDKNENISKILDKLPYESVIKVKGVVLSRPIDMQNKKQLTGAIEVNVHELIVLNRITEDLPFNIRNFQKANEPLRMQYRYLDLRFAEMQRNLRVRSKLLMKMREYLINVCNFVDVETPTLFKSTPGGAQEFIVPTRLPGLFYSLVQSPQQFKQMLMGGAIDRYFQIARCFRDEGSRPDRQPEFTQLDVEMSFTDSEGVMGLIEELLRYSWPEDADPLPLTFKRIKYETALEEYGSDKPDTRFGFKLINCSMSVDATTYCLIFDEEFDVFTTKIKNNIDKISKQYPLAKLVYFKVDSKKDWSKPLVKLLGQERVLKLEIPDNSVAFFATGNKKQVQALLGKIRLEYVENLQRNGKDVIKRGMHFLWVTDFPLFEEGESPGALSTVHHPFTAPHPDDLHLLQENPLKMRALAYDLVLNGHEIGGGSIRIHDPKLQEDILDVLKISKSTLEHMLKMLGSGCPPHGGIALGIDRLLAVVLKAKSIRDVIAFPKNFDGRDPISGAPSAISENDKKIYHIKSIE